MPPPRFVGRLFNLRERLRSSFLATPLLSIVAAALTAQGLSWVDRDVLRGQPRWFLLDMQPEVARESLSIIASSIINVIGIVFSITVLVLQQASNQFSPRVLRAFLQDHITHLAMSCFVATFVFALVLLPELEMPGLDGAAGFSPKLSLTVAYLLVALSVGMLVRYIDHMGQAVRAINIIRRMCKEGMSGIRTLYPEDIGRDAPGGQERPAGPPSRTVHHRGVAGVLTEVDGRRLLRLATKHDLVVEVSSPVGTFIPQHTPLMRVWGGNGPDDEALLDTLSIGAERTPQHDVAFSFRTLVDIAERALSPSINDPTTATQALDHLHVLLRALAVRPFPSPFRADPQGALRLILPRPGWDDYVHHALDEIREYGTHSLQVLRRLRLLLADLREVAPPERLPPLEEQQELLEAAVQRSLTAVPEQQRALGTEGVGRRPR